MILFWTLFFLLLPLNRSKYHQNPNGSSTVFRQLTVRFPDFELQTNTVGLVEIFDGVAIYEYKMLLRRQHQHKRSLHLRKAVDQNQAFSGLIALNNDEIVGDAVLTLNVKSSSLHLSGILSLNNTQYLMAPSFWNTSTGSFVHTLEPVELHSTARKRCAVAKLPETKRPLQPQTSETGRTLKVQPKSTSSPPPAGTNRVLQLAVFSDHVLYKSFQKKYPGKVLENVTNYVMTIVNSMNYLYQDSSLDQGNKLQIRLTTLEIFSKPVKSLKTGDGNEGVYLSSFCKYAESKNKGGKKWDHAVMLTGLDLKGRESSDIIGVAYAASMCDPSYSCSLIEGSNFLAAYTLAHEMGHSLGMNHDGEENNKQCDGKKYIMAAIEGAGQTLWSKCSNENMRSFLAGRSSIKGASKPTCLKTSRARSGRKKPGFPYRSARLPGQVYSAQAQCAIAMGDGASKALPVSAEACQELYCSNGTYAYRTHPALEGTSCGSSKWCKRGACVSKF